MPGHWQVSLQDSGGTARSAEKPSDDPKNVGDIFTTRSRWQNDEHSRLHRIGPKNSIATDTLPLKEGTGTQGFNKVRDGEPTATSDHKGKASSAADNVRPEGIQGGRLHGISVCSLPQQRKRRLQAETCESERHWSDG